MDERPILFSGSMVRAILEGRKTNTRRVVKLNYAGRIARSGKQWHVDDPAAALGCPYGQSGDLLWVRETWGLPWHHAQRPYFYRATDEDAVGWHPDFDGWKPSIHMPRSASRISLEVAGVRVERVQDISAEDAWAEGIPHSPDVNPLHEFEELWDSINAKRGFGWDANPLVWVVEFRKAEG